MEHNFFILAGAKIAKELWIRGHVDFPVLVSFLGFCSFSLRKKYFVVYLFAEKEYFLGNCLRNQFEIKFWTEILRYLKRNLQFLMYSLLRQYQHS